MNKKIHKLKRFDIGVLKIDIILFSILLVKLFPVLASAHWGWYVAGILVCELYLWDRLFGGKSK